MPPGNPPWAITQSRTHTSNDSHNSEITRPCSTTIFVRNGLTVDNASVSENDNIEILSIELMGISVSSVYKPSIETCILPNAVTDGLVNVVIGDLNSHSVTWGYGETNEDGESVGIGRMQIRCHSYMMQSSPTPLTAVGGDVDTTLT